MVYFKSQGVQHFGMVKKKKKSTPSPAWQAYTLIQTIRTEHKPPPLKVLAKWINWLSTDLIPDVFT